MRCGAKQLIMIACLDMRKGRDAKPYLAKKVHHLLLCDVG